MKNNKGITLNIETIEKVKENLEKQINFLSNYIQNGKLFLPELRKKGGIYAFWWIGEKKKLAEALTSCDYRLKGKQSEKELISVKFTHEWIDVASIETKEICLYIGKSTNIKSRISKHIKLSTKDIWTKTGVSRKSGIKPNTESQLRIGLERIFNKSIMNEIIDNIGISWIILEEYENGINRFYLEDYFIGRYYPLFNIDIER